MPQRAHPIFQPPFRFGLGGVPLGNEFAKHTDADAQATLEAAWKLGVRYYDVAPWYGMGLSERRFGHFLHGQRRDDYVLSSKVGKLFKASRTNRHAEIFPFSDSPNDLVIDYTADGVRRSIEDSLQRLGVSHLDVAFVHDLSPDFAWFPTGWEEQYEIARKGAFPALSKMRDEGIIRAWGVGVNTPFAIRKVIEDADPDVCLCARQYSLIDHADALDHLFPAVRAKGVSLVIGSVAQRRLPLGQPALQLRRGKLPHPARGDSEARPVARGRGPPRRRSAHRGAAVLGGRPGGGGARRRRTQRRADPGRLERDAGQDPRGFLERVEARQAGRAERAHPWASTDARTRADILAQAMIAAPDDAMRHLDLPRGAAPLSLPVLGLGTWRFGESGATRSAEMASVRTALELGYRLIDTAEMYGEGGAEEVVGAALDDALRAGDVRRDEVVVVSKVYPHNASRQGTRLACDRSRQRLGLDRIDVYLLHWRGAHPLVETVEALRELAATGGIGRWGVSNFDVDDMEELAGLGDDCALNQVWYSLGERDPEFALLPWLRARGMPLMAYSPIDQGRVAEDPVLRAIAAARGLTATQVALARLLAHAGVMAIPKATGAAHLRENLAAVDVVLSADELRAIDRRYPPPTRKTTLAMN